MTPLPLFVRADGMRVIVLGTGEGAEAKRRLLARAGAVIVDDEAADARIAVIALADEAEASAAAARLRARGVLVNAVDRPAISDFHFPAVVDRAPVLVAVGTGGASAGLAAALRQRIEALLPARIGGLADALFAARPAIHARWPEMDDRRRAIAAALAPGGALDPLGARPDVERWLAAPTAPAPDLTRITLASPDPEELTLRAARALAQADRVYFSADVPAAILDRARADAARVPGPAPAETPQGRTVVLEMVR